MKKLNFARLLFIVSLLAFVHCKGPKGDPGPQGPNGTPYITLSTPTNISITGAKLSGTGGCSSLPDFGGSSSPVNITLDRLYNDDRIDYEINGASSTGVLNLSYLGNANGSKLILSLNTNGKPLSALTVSDIDNISVIIQAYTPVSGGFHFKYIYASDGNTSSYSLSNDDTIDITALSYNSSTGVLTLNMTLQDDAGDGDGNGNNITDTINYTCSPFSTTINMQIPVSTVTQRVVK